MADIWRGWPKGLWGTGKVNEATLGGLPAHRWVSGFLRERFGGRVVKIPLDLGGVTCPNRDPLTGAGGCAWCDPGGSGPDGPERALSWEASLRQDAARARRKSSKGVIAYFQAFSPTHYGAGRLEAAIRTALSVPGVVGLALASRPDGLSPKVLNLLEALSGETFLWVELGMQTMHDATLATCNRGHTHAQTVEAVEALRARGIRCVLHLIAGLPGESEEQMRQSFAEAARLAPWGVKLHPLHIVRGAPLEVPWREGKVPLLSLDAYAGLAADLLKTLPPETVIHRLGGEREGEMHLAPEWCLHKKALLEAIERAVRGGA